MLIERISYDINWKEFRAGTSFFIPCIDSELAKAEVMQVTQRLKIEVLMKICIEDGIMGLRIWKL
jgi:hypothetical protein